MAIFWKVLKQCHPETMTDNLLLRSGDVGYVIELDREKFKLGDRQLCKTPECVKFFKLDDVDGNLQ